MKILLDNQKVSADIRGECGNRQRELIAGSTLPDRFLKCHIHA